MKSQSLDTKKILASSLKDACQDFDIDIMKLSETSGLNFTAWYKRLSGKTEIKLIDLLVICEATNTDVIKFVAYISNRYDLMTEAAGKAPRVHDEISTASW